MVHGRRRQGPQNSDKQGTSLAVQSLGPPSNAGGAGSVPN